MTLVIGIGGALLGRPGGDILATVQSGILSPQNQKSDLAIIARFAVIDA